MKKVIVTLTVIAVIALAAWTGATDVHSAIPQKQNSDNADTFRVGWISPMTGPAAKYGADRAALLAVDDINAKGGILGRRLELIMEDGRCSGPDAAMSAHKLIEADKVKFILGGHCSTETAAIAPIVEAAKVVTLASITSNPDITHAGDYIFRTTATGTAPVEMLAHFMREKLHYDTIAIVHELTPYAAPPSEYLKARFIELGGKEAEIVSFNPGDTDFKTILARVRALNPDGVYFAVQAQDTAALLVQQAHQMGLSRQMFGNEVVGNAITQRSDTSAAFEGLIYAEAAFDESSPRAKRFTESFNSKFNTSELPYGYWTAESYDAVVLLADLINKCGPDKEEVKKCMYKVKDFQGASGTISIDQNGDGVRKFALKQVKGGKFLVLED